MNNTDKLKLNAPHGFCHKNICVESVPNSQLDGKYLWSEVSKSQFIQAINSEISIKRFSDYMAALDLHEFRCSDEVVQTFNTIILDTTKESVTFKYRKKSTHKRKNKKNLEWIKTVLA